MAGSANTSVETLAGAEEYFLLVIKPNYDSFFGAPSNFASALNLVVSLFHFHEWLFNGHKSEIEIEFGQTFSSAGAFWKAVEHTNSRFGYIRDVANASKHVAIGRFPTSTGMTHIANTHIVVTGFGNSAYGVGRYGGGPEVFFEDSGKRVSFDDCANDMFSYWKCLLEKLTGKVFVFT